MILILIDTDGQTIFFLIDVSEMFLIDRDRRMIVSKLYREANELFLIDLGRQARCLLFLQLDRGIVNIDISKLIQQLAFP